MNQMYLSFRREKRRRISSLCVQKRRSFGFAQDDRYSVNHFASNPKKKDRYTLGKKCNGLREGGK